MLNSGTPYRNPMFWGWRVVIALVAVSTMSLLLAVTGAAFIRQGWFSWLDRISLSGNYADPFFHAVTWFGTTPGVAITGIIMLVILLALKLFQPGFIFFLSLASSAVVNDVVKDWVARARPVGVTEPGFAFPSGHAFVCTAVYGLFTLILIQRFPSRGVQRYTVATAVLFLLLIGYSRLYLGVHYMSDVVAGWLLGLGWLAAFAPTVVMPQKQSEVDISVVVPKSP